MHSRKPGGFLGFLGRQAGCIRLLACTPHLMLHCTCSLQNVCRCNAPAGVQHSYWRFSQAAVTNAASGAQGGALALSTGSLATLDSCDFSGNTAGQSGGALAVLGCAKSDATPLYASTLHIISGLLSADLHSRSQSCQPKPRRAPEPRHAAFKDLACHVPVSLRAG